MTREKTEEAGRSRTRSDSFVEWAHSRCPDYMAFFYEELYETWTVLECGNCLSEKGSSRKMTFGTKACELLLVFWGPLGESPKDHFERLHL